MSDLDAVLSQSTAGEWGRVDAFLAPSLAPEFLVSGDSGAVQGKNARMQLPPEVTAFTIDSVTASRGDDVLVVSYRTTFQAPDGVAQTTPVARLAAFRWANGAWRMAAYSRFGGLPQVSNLSAVASARTSSLRPAARPRAR